MVRVSPDPLFSMCRPKEDEPGQFAAGRLLLPSRMSTAGSRGTAWHSLNDAIAEMALASGGAALYVARTKSGAERDWRFRKGAG